LGVDTIILNFYLFCPVLFAGESKNKSKQIGGKRVKPVLRAAQRYAVVKVQRVWHLFYYDRLGEFFNCINVQVCLHLCAYFKCLSCGWEYLTSGSEEPSPIDRAMLPEMRAAASAGVGESVLCNSVRLSSIG
jgi:hypothetical protein